MNEKLFSPSRLKDFITLIDSWNSSYLYSEGLLYITVALSRKNVCLAGGGVLTPVCALDVASLPFLTWILLPFLGHLH